jgi:pantetheine-phosphate adenylyltransferase
LATYWELEYMTNVAVYTGSFDPVTLGHLNVIERACKLCDELVVGVGINSDKKSLFSPEERVALLETVVGSFPNVRVQTFAGLAVSFVRECGSRVMVRGVRPLTDFAGEFTMLMANRQLDPDIEAIFLMADEDYAHVSSSLIKQIVPLSSDEMLARFVPPQIIAPLRKKLAETAL